MKSQQQDSVRTGEHYTEQWHQNQPNVRGLVCHAEEKIAGTSISLFQNLINQKLCLIRPGSPGKLKKQAEYPIVGLGAATPHNHFLA